MFFKKREWVAPGWREEWNRKQGMYARRFADWLGKKAATVPPTRMRVYVIVFLMAMAGLDLAVTVGSMREHRGAAPFGEPQPLMVPAPRFHTKGDFGSYLDSIRHNTAIGKEFDSLLRARPGFLDSLRLLEGMEP